MSHPKKGDIVSSVCNQCGETFEYASAGNGPRGVRKQCGEKCRKLRNRASKLASDRRRRELAKRFLLLTVVLGCGGVAAPAPAEPVELDGDCYEQNGWICCEETCTCDGIVRAGEDLVATSEDRCDAQSE